MLAPEIDALHVGVGLDFFRRAMLVDGAIVHHRDPIDDAQRDVEIVLDDDEADMPRHRREDLHQIALAVEARWSIDPARRFITGLSSGGAMSVVASVTHNEYWAAAASASGLPYGEDAAAVSFSGCPGSATFHPVARVVSDMKAQINDAYAIPLMVLQNAGDCTVLQQAGNNLRDAQLAAWGDAAHDTPGEARAVARTCSPVFNADYSCQQTI